jgi:uncharacterized protein YcnI
MRKIVRVLPPLGVAAGALVLLAAPAGAHVSPDTDEVAAGGRATVGFATSHGCEESPTNAMVFEIPEPIVSVNPVVHPGWDIEIEMEELAEPVEAAHGDPITERAKTVTFTAQAGNELTNGLRDTFGISFQVPEDAEGEALFFKVIQQCPDGETPWIEEYTGEGEEPEHPAPVVMVGPAEPEEGEEVAAEPASTEEVAAADDSDDGSSSDGLAIAGIVMGTLGLAAGGYSILKANRKPASS